MGYFSGTPMQALPAMAFDHPATLKRNHFDYI
jgi:hypothetical protein